MAQVTIAAAAGSFQFVYATKLNVCDEHESDGDDADGHDVPPEVPRRLMRNTLLRQIDRTFDPVKRNNTSDTKELYDIFNQF